MRFIHTADWHLGKSLFGVSLLTDQEYALNSLYDILGSTRADALVIAGDIYDRAVPSADAVLLMSDFIQRVNNNLQIPIIAIAGNHDCATRIDFGRDVFAKQEIYMAGKLRITDNSINLRDDFGPLTFHLTPFTDPPTARDLFKQELQNHDQVMGAVCQMVLEDFVESHRHIMVSHAFVGGGKVCDSERPLTVGGSESVALDHFDPFVYTALGHLHRPQQMLGTTGNVVRYSGSLLKYSFSEAEHKKSVSLVEVGPEACTNISEINLNIKHDLRVIQGLFKDLLENPQGNVDDYLLVRLEDKFAVFEAMSRLREVYPNVLHIERVSNQTEGEEITGGIDRRKLDNATLLDLFYETVSQNVPDDETKTLFEQAYVKSRTLE
jgi:DNA repair protein SbcD/Mre11